jgi:rRNA processing protein Krr1/Pno1
MGGSGSGGYTPSAPSSPCSRLSFQATLNSPKASVLAQLQEGSVLEVELDSSGKSVEVLFKSQVAGSVTGSKVAQLINCLTSGFTFRAVVVTLTGGQCLLRIEPA